MGKLPYCNRHHCHPTLLIYTLYSRRQFGEYSLWEARRTLLISANYLIVFSRQEQTRVMEAPVSFCSLLVGSYP